MPYLSKLDTVAQFQAGLEVLPKGHFCIDKGYSFVTRYTLSLAHTAIRYSTLQHTATHCSTLQHTTSILIEDKRYVPTQNSL